MELVKSHAEIRFGGILKYVSEVSRIVRKASAIPSDKNT